MANMVGLKAHRSGPKAHRGGLKAHQTPPERLEFEGRVAPSNSSIKNINTMYISILGVSPCLNFGHHLINPGGL